MGLETARLLSAKGWTLHIFDMNKEAGTKVAQELPKATFHQVDATKWESLSTAFDNVFNTAGTIDFVFANAGIVERDNFYATIDARPPPPVNQLSIDINYKAVVDTAYLAQHYFRSSPHKGKDAALVMTASCGALVS
jgi:NAD(P)-dependent dehydrogenase (short-subunit alcohol dehydrogenase family)